MRNIFVFTDFIMIETHKTAQNAGPFEMQFIATDVNDKYCEHILREHTQLTWEQKVRFVIATNVKIHPMATDILKHTQETNIDVKQGHEDWICEHWQQHAGGK